MADQVDDLDDLELFDEHDLLSSGEYSSDSESSGSRSDHDDEPQQYSEEHIQAIRTTVIDIVTALGGIEEEQLPDGTIRSVYIIGDDCLRCLRDLRALLHQDQDDPSRIIPKIYGEVKVVQQGLIPLLLKTADMGERGAKIALACSKSSVLIAVESSLSL